MESVLDSVIFELQETKMSVKINLYVNTKNVVWNLLESLKKH